GQPNDDLIGARAQEKPHARAGQDADAEGKDELHQASSSALAASTARTRWLRTDWWASAMSISTVAPTTSENTPRSNSRAEAVGTFPMNGISVYWKYEVRNGMPNSH